MLNISEVVSIGLVLCMPSNRKRSFGYYIALAMTYILLVLVMLIPPNARTPEVIPSVFLFAAIIILPMVACNIGSKSRPQFQSAYHGVETVVMEELYEEVSS